MRYYKIKTAKNRYRFVTGEQIQTAGYFVASAILLLALIAGEFLKG